MRTDREGLFTSALYLEFMTTSEDDSQIENKKLSKEFYAKLDEWFDHLANMVSLCEKIKLVGIREGLSESTVRQLTKDRIESPPELVDAFFNQDYDAIVDISLKMSGIK